MLEGRHTFGFVHEDDLTAQSFKPYAALILPNVAYMSDAQCRALEAYVDAGGSLIADFETRLCDERGAPRANFGLARLFGMTKVGDRAGSRGFENSFYARIEQQHELLRGFSNTNWLAGAEWRVPVRAGGPPVLTVVPPYSAYPTETVYSPTPRTDEHAVIARERGASRLVYFAGDVGRTFWRSGHSDPLRLILNSLEWVLRGRRPVRVEGDGLIEIFAWETEAGFALHLLNLNNPNLHRGVILKHSPIDTQRVQFEFPRDARIRRVTALRAEKHLPFQQKGRTVEFTIPSITGYELAALEWRGTRIRDQC